MSAQAATTTPQHMATARRNTRGVESAMRGSAHQTAIPGRPTRQRYASALYDEPQWSASNARHPQPRRANPPVNAPVRRQPRTSSRPAFTNTSALFPRLAQLWQQHLQKRLFPAFLTGLFLFGTVQVVRGLWVDSARLVQLLQTQQGLTAIHHDTVNYYNNLHHKIALYQSPQGIEALARDHLDRVGPNEILVRMP